MSCTRYFLAIIPLIFWVSPLLGQKKCATTFHEHKTEKKLDFEKWLKQKMQLQPAQPLRSNQEKQEQAVLVTIPVVIHVVHVGENLGAGGNVPDGQVFSQIDILNEDFRRQNADTVNTPAEFKPVAADIEIEFVLARRDPSGQATTGINRIQGAKSSWDAFSVIDDMQLKSTIYWPAEDYLNIWVTALQDNVLGYATFPESTLPGINDPEENRLLDGIVIDYNFFGEGFNALLFSKGRTATHEIGHFLGLRHMDGDPTFGVDGCSVDDFVDDTPLVESQASGCPTGFASCGSTDMIQNYMDFSDDECMNIFTEQQKDRMRTVIENSPRRLSLTTSPGLIPPVLAFDLGIASINNPSLVNCEESTIPSVTVTNFGTDPISSFEVVFQLVGGQSLTVTHSDSTLESTESVTLLFPSVILPEGQFQASVNIQNVAKGDENPTNDNLSETRFLSLDEDFIPLREEYPNGLIDDGWFVINFDNNLTWGISDAGNPGFAAIMNHFNNVEIGTENWLVSPLLDFSSATAASLKFDVSYGINAGRSDVLRVWVSTDCGQSFNELVYEKAGIELATNSSITSWEPAGPADYRTDIIDLSEFAGEPEVRVAFVAINDFGNNLYLDNIEFFTTGADFLVETPRSSIKLYPNPTSDDLNLVVNLDTRETLTIEVMDASGRVLYTEDFANGLNQTFTYDISPLPAGLYLVRARGRFIDETERLIKLR